VAPGPMLAALLRFHLHVGARLAMRTFVPVLVAAVAGIMLLGPYFLNSFSSLLWGPGSKGGSGVLIAVFCYAAAASAAPRVCRGLDGWLRHLPIGGRAQRRAAALAIAVAQVPLLLGLIFLSLVATHLGRATWIDALSLLVCAAAASLLAMPVQRAFLTRPLALASAVVAVSGGWLLLGAGTILLLGADLCAGELPRAKRSSLAGRRTRRAIGRWTGAFVELRIAWRALRWRLLSAATVGLLPLAGAAAFVAHNELAPRHVRLAALLGGGCAVVFLFSDLGEVLGARRPAWPWSRSLPWSARRRVLFDAGFLAAHAIPAILLTAWIDGPSCLAVLAITPWLAVRAAGAMRRAPERRTGASGEILMGGLLLAAAVALLPWVAILPPLATPWALRAAAKRDRQQKVSRWLELHHLAVGDPQSWSS
jgi:hypothetical protein